MNTQDKRTIVMCLILFTILILVKTATAGNFTTGFEDGNLDGWEIVNDTSDCAADHYCGEIYDNTGSDSCAGSTFDSMVDNNMSGQYAAVFEFSSSYECDEQIELRKNITFPTTGAVNVTINWFSRVANYKNTTLDVYIAGTTDDLILINSHNGIITGSDDNGEESDTGDGQVTYYTQAEFASVSSGTRDVRIRWYDTWSLNSGQWAQLMIDDIYISHAGADAPPAPESPVNITMYAPCKGRIQEQSATFFIWNVTTLDSATDYCRIYLNGTNISQFTPANDTIEGQEFMLSEGDHEWGMYCVLENGTSLWANENITFTVDISGTLTGTLINDSSASTALVSDYDDAFDHWMGGNWNTAVQIRNEIDTLGITDKSYRISATHFYDTDTYAPNEGAYNETFIDWQVSQAATMMDSTYNNLAYRNLVEGIDMYDEYPTGYKEDSNCEAAVERFSTEFIAEYDYTPDCDNYGWGHNETQHHDFNKFVREGAARANSNLYLKLKARYANWTIYHVVAAPYSTTDAMYTYHRLVDMNGSHDAVLIQGTYIYDEYVGDAGYHDMSTNANYVKYIKSQNPGRRIQTLIQNFESPRENSELNATPETVVYQTWRAIIAGSDDIMYWSREYDHPNNCMVYNCSGYGETEGLWAATVNISRSIKDETYTSKPADALLIYPEDTAMVGGGNFPEDDVELRGRVRLATDRMAELGLNYDIYGTRAIEKNTSIIDDYNTIICLQCHYENTNLREIIKTYSGSKNIIFDSNAFIAYSNGTEDFGPDIFENLTGIDCVNRASFYIDKLYYPNGTTLSFTSPALESYTVENDTECLPGEVIYSGDDKSVLLYKYNNNYFIGLDMADSLPNRTEHRIATGSIWDYILSDIGYNDEEYHINNFNASQIRFLNRTTTNHSWLLSWYYNNETYNFSTGSNKNYTVSWNMTAGKSSVTLIGEYTYLSGTIYDSLMFNIGGEATAPPVLCVQSQSNTTTSWYGACTTSDNRTLWQNITQDIEWANCTNETKYYYDQYVTNGSCDYCSYNTITSYGAWSNATESCGWRTGYTWDDNYNVCANTTNISTDFYSLDNWTYWGNYTSNETSTCTSTSSVSDTGMLSIVLVMIFIIIYYFVCGAMIYNSNKMVGFTSFSISFIHLFVLFALVYVNLASGSTAMLALLGNVFKIDFVLGIGVGMFALYTVLIRMTGSHAEPGKWGEVWRK